MSTTKIDLSDVAAVLKHQQLDPAVLRRIIEELNAKVDEKAAESAAENDDKPPAVKTQWVILVSDPNGVIPAGIDLVGWAFQIEESAPASAILGRVRDVGYAYNATRKGRLYPAKSLGEVIEAAPKKLWAAKEGEKTLPKHKVPVQVVVTTNVLPRG